ncbi:MAG TPA: MFS transporter [Acidimicrobiales bacterium]|jgi:predicted MFS family arabinose efflux permease|nr:MFS transporter [Acidimicrobiales bacterium]
MNEGTGGRRRGVFVDIAPLRDSETFRRLFGTSLPAQIGQQAGTVVVAYEVYRITGSTLDVGAVSALQLLSIIVCSLTSGSLADRHDRRRIVQSGQLIALIGALALVAARTANSHLLWPYFVFPVLMSAGASISGPASSGAVGGSVPKEQMHSAAALMQTTNQLAVVVGPALGGLLIGASGVDAAMWFNVAMFALAVGSSLRLRELRPVGAANVSRGLRSIVDGVRFAATSPALSGIFIADSMAMVLGLPRAVFPALVVHSHLGSPSVLGLLYAAPGIGAIIGGFTSGWVGLIVRQGRAVLFAIAGWGAAIAIFGLVHNLPLDLLLLAVAGWSDVISSIFRGTILQINAPDALRARVSSLNLVVVTGAPRLGDLEAGATAAAFGTTTSIFAGGVACILGAIVLGIASPVFRNYRSPHIRQADAVPVPT